MLFSDLKTGTYDNVAILFSDIRNFTKVTSDLPIEEAMHLLQVYFDEMARIIMAHEGIVGSFVGDAIVGYFGIDGSKHGADNAARAALQIKEQIKYVNIGRDIPILNGVGLDKGTVMVGTVTAGKALQQTIIIGDPINRASRFEQLTRMSCHRIIMPTTFYKSLLPQQQRFFVEIGLVEVRGIAEFVDVCGDVLGEE